MKLQIGRWLLVSGTFFDEGRFLLTSSLLVHRVPLPPAIVPLYSHLLSEKCENNRLFTISLLKSSSLVEIALADWRLFLVLIALHLTECKADRQLVYLLIIILRVFSKVEPRSRIVSRHPQRLGIRPGPILAS